MTLIDALLATIAAEDGGVVQGRTLLQKKLYFLSVLTGEDFGFSPYFYGPYSSDVSAQLGTLIQAGFVEETSVSLPVLSAPQYEPKLFHYRLSPVGQEVLPQIQEDLVQYREALARVNGHPVAKSAKPLAIAAKVHLISSGERLDAGEIQRRAIQFGWTLEDRDIVQATEYLEHLGLAAEHQQHRLPAGSRSR